MHDVYQKMQHNEQQFYLLGQSIFDWGVGGKGGWGEEWVGGMSA